MKRNKKLMLYAVEFVAGMAMVILAVWLGIQYFQKALPFGDGALGIVWSYTGWLWTIILALAGIEAVEHAI